MNQALHVYFICGMGTSFEQRLVRGMARHAVEAGWKLRWGGPLPAAKLTVTNCGVLVFALSDVDLAEVKRCGLPVVSVSSRNLGQGLPSVVTDDEAIGAAAAAHFHERYYQSFAFVGSDALSFSGRRQAGFEKALGGRDCAIHLIDDTGGSEAGSRALEVFLAGLPVATAVFAASDIHARRTCAAGLAAGRRIPDDLAVLGADADDLVSLSSPVQLSSVDTNPQQIGYRAAQLLGQMLGKRGMRHRVPADTVERIPPGGVVSAHSTDALAASDDLVQRAAAVIRDRAYAGLRVDELARSCGCNRRTLELRFRAVTGGSIADRIRAARIGQAKALLATNLSASAIAERTGFGTCAYFSDAFKKATGLPPSEFRARLGHWDQ